MAIEKIKSWLAKYGKWLVVIACLLVFTLLAEDVVEKEPLFVDHFNAIVAEGRAPWLTPTVKSWTDMGIVTIPHLLIIFCLIFVKDKRLGIMAGINLLVADSFNLFLKGIFRRPRPHGALMHIGGYSFPSGHSMIAMIFYGFLIYLVWQCARQQWLKYLLTVLLSMVIVFIGWTRIYLGVHYTSDVLASFAISVVYLIVATSLAQYVFALYDRLLKQRRHKHN